jgi:hypothetical protein
MLAVIGIQEWWPLMLIVLALDYWLTRTKARR